MRLGFIILAASVLACCGCAPKAASDLRPIGEETPQSGELSSRQQREVLRAMASVAPDHRRIALPAPRVRWADVELAAQLAAAENEMAIARKEKADHEWVFTIKTIDDRRGELVVERLDGPQVYRATARIGRMEADEERAATLVDRFDRIMQRLGRKRHVKDPR